MQRIVAGISKKKKKKKVVVWESSRRCLSRPEKSASAPLEGLKVHCGSLRKEPGLLRGCCSCCSVAHSCATLCNPILQHTRLPCPSPSLRDCSNLYPLMSSNPLILCRPLLLLPQSFPASGSFPMSQLFSPYGQSIGASASVLPVIVQD